MKHTLKVIGVLILTAILIYVAIIYNSVSILFLAIGMPLFFLFELILIGIQRKKLLVETQLLNSQAICSQTITMRIQMQNKSKIPLLNIKVFVSGLREPLGIDLSAEGTATLLCDVPMNSCGQFYIQIDEIRLSDWLQFFSVQMPVTATSHLVYVYPDTMEVTIPKLTHMEGEETDQALEGYLGQNPTIFDGVRDYEPGDSLKQIHWKMTAKTGELSVKKYTEALVAKAVLFVDISSIRKHTSDEQNEIWSRFFSTSEQLLRQNIPHAIVWNEPMNRSVVQQKSEIYSVLNLLYEEIYNLEQEKKDTVYGKETLERYRQIYEPMPEENVFFFR